MSTLRSHVRIYNWLKPFGYIWQYLTICIYTSTPSHNILCTLPILWQTQVVNLPDWALGPTVVTVDLSYTNYTQVWQYYMHTYVCKLVPQSCTKTSSVTSTSICTVHLESFKDPVGSSNTSKYVEASWVLVGMPRLLPSWVIWAGSPLQQSLRSPV